MAYRFESSTLDRLAGNDAFQQALNQALEKQQKLRDQTGPVAVSAGVPQKTPSRSMNEQGGVVPEFAQAIEENPDFFGRWKDLYLAGEDLRGGGQGGFA